MSTAVDAYGQLDALVNNAGLVRDRMLVNMSEEEWDLVLQVDLKGHFVPLRHAAAYWKDRSKAGQRARGARRQHLLAVPGCSAASGRATTPPPRPASSR